MVQSFAEGRLVFEFDDAALCRKFDDMAFYRRQFVNFAGGSKAVDFVCLREATAWLIEVKGYRHNRRQKNMALVEEVSAKVRDSMVCCVAGFRNGNDPKERQIFGKVIQADRFRVVLHLEQNDHGNRDFPPNVNRANCLQKLKQVLRALNAHPRVVDQTMLLPGMPWTVRNAREGDL